MNKTMNDYIIQQRSNCTNKYYVYRHIRLSNGTVFYVGKGCGSRAWSKHSRNPHWNHTYKKHGMRVEIVADNLDEKSSLDLEVVKIKEYLESGYNLCNKSGGGESPIVTDETRLKMSLAHKGVKKSPEHAAAVSRAKSGVKRPDLAGENNPNKDVMVYNFLNIKTQELFSGTRTSLCKEKQISSNLLRGLFLTKPRKLSQDWGLIQLGEDVADAIKRLVTKEINDTRKQTKTKT